MTEIKREVLEAADRFVELTVNVLSDERGVHVETAIAALARMAGTFLFRSFNLPLRDAVPGQACLSDAANEQGPTLMQLAGVLLVNNGVQLDPGKLGPHEQHQPGLAFLETQRTFEPRFSAVKDELGLSNVEAAHASAVATAMLVNKGRAVLDPNIAFGIAVYGFVEGTKTVPDPVVVG